MKLPSLILALALVLSQSGCGDVSEATGDYPNRVSFKINGVPYEPELTYGFNDLEVEPKRFTEHWSMMVHAAEEDGYCLTINVQPSQPTGQATLRPTLDAPDDGAFFLMHPCGQFEKEDLFFPLFDSSIELRTIGGPDGRLSVAFDTLVLRNGCGENLILTEGDIDVRIVTTEVLPDDAFTWMEPDTLVEERRGFSTLDGTSQPFTAVYVGFTENSSQGSYETDIVNLCNHDSFVGEEQGIKLSIPMSVESGDYVATDLTTDFWLLDLRSQDENAFNGAFWRGIYSGSVSIVRPNQTPGFMTIRIQEPLVFREVIQGGGSVSWGDRHQVTFNSGVFYTWVP